MVDTEVIQEMLFNLMDKVEKGDQLLCVRKFKGTRAKFTEGKIYEVVFAGKYPHIREDNGSFTSFYMWGSIFRILPRAPSITVEDILGG